MGHDVDVRGPPSLVKKLNYLSPPSELWELSFCVCLFTHTTTPLKLRQVVVNLRVVPVAL